MDAYIARAQAVNPAINALVAERFEAARREADQADALVRQGADLSGRPFHGVPCTIKVRIPPWGDAGVTWRGAPDATSPFLGGWWGGERHGSHGRQEAFALTGMPNTSGT